MATMESSSARLPVGTVSRPGASALFFKVLSFILRDFFRSVWVLVLLGVLVAFHILFFNASPTQSHFFSVQYAFVLVVAAIAAGAMFSRANRPETHALLARPVSRASLTGAIMLAAWLVTVAAYLISTAAVLIRYSSLFGDNVALSAWADAPTLLYGILPMLTIAVVAVGVTGLLSTFVSPSILRLVILTLIAVLIMSFDNRNFPIEAIRPALQALPPVLAPIAGALHYATEPVRDNLATVSLGMLAGYAFFLVLIVLWLSSSRETALD